MVRGGQTQRGGLGGRGKASNRGAQASHRIVTLIATASFVSVQRAYFTLPNDPSPNVWYNSYLPTVLGAFAAATAAAGLAMI